MSYACDDVGARPQADEWQASRQVSGLMDQEGVYWGRQCLNLAPSPQDYINI